MLIKKSTFRKIFQESIDKDVVRQSLRKFRGASQDEKIALLGMMVDYLAGTSRENNSDFTSRFAGVKRVKDPKNIVDKMFSAGDEEPAEKGKDDSILDPRHGDQGDFGSEVGPTSAPLPDATKDATPWEKTRMGSTQAPDVSGLFSKGPTEPKKKKDTPKKSREPEKQDRFHQIGKPRTTPPPLPSKRGKNKDLPSLSTLAKRELGK